jgi:uncharacterized DUF497 family protein
MIITWTEAKRLITLEERGLDFARAAEIFTGLHVTRPTMAARAVKFASSPRVSSKSVWW